MDVLVADDEPRLAALIRLTLSPDRYCLVEASDGAGDAGGGGTMPPRLALLDVQMPERTGLELARAIRDDPSLASTRIILISAYGEPRDIAAGLAAGADAYLTKPFSPKALRALVDRLAGA